MLSKPGIGVVKVTEVKEDERTTGNKSWIWISRGEVSEKSGGDNAM